MAIRAGKEEASLHVEGALGVPHHHPEKDHSARLHLPDSLQGYNDDELLVLEQKLVRKVDRRLIPILGVMYLLNILDRNSIANARLGGLEKDLHLTDVQYQTALMILFPGYILCMIPSNMLLSIVKPRFYIPSCVIAWGIVSGSTGFTHSYAGLVIVRFLTGCMEAPYFGGTIFLLSCWYRKSELPPRIAIFYAGYTLASAFGGLIAAGIIGGMEGVGGLHSWRWLFIIEGLATVCAGAIAMILLPNYPRTTSWLTAEERVLAEYRLAKEADGEADDVVESVFVGLKQAFSDPMVWLLVFIDTCAVVGQAFTAFFPTIVKTLGYGNIKTLLLTAPPFFLSFFFNIGNAWHSARTQERTFHIVFACCISAIGQIICVSTVSVPGRYFAMFLMATGVFSAFQLILSWISATIPRPKAKRAVALGMATAVSNSMNIGLAYLYPKYDAPRYHIGGIVTTVALISCAVASVVLRRWLKKLNDKADRDVGHEGVAGGEGVNFRYVL